ncbi:uncharacterized protein L969DRAFT_100986 [Mixia osmundae IAM 14324]|uniref:Granulins domain-containing protein n=1 Tax=Mixia osmundae (strain CBS 9802 / IAM 14324 / JCM 22182 / KY 12970) TaxID=764103 RepID=G7E306_MIXOS|nr:uncharacterized protein L969DRAFT_100986 [Mixia osmundae IAM 14324]KEI42524.1 hypothetical protein L969DRAFT_100986 [Mixia osmundae IAM 14324]GAA97187.1 hypothetical protein E5Q_03863 [Mixia osmundae IAM 14324]
MIVALLPLLIVARAAFALAAPHIVDPHIPGCPIYDNSCGPDLTDHKKICCNAWGEYKCFEGCATFGKDSQFQCCMNGKASGRCGPFGVAERSNEHDAAYNLDGSSCCWKGKGTSTCCDFHGDRHCFSETCDVFANDYRCCASSQGSASCGPFGVGP